MPHFARHGENQTYARKIKIKGDLIRTERNAHDTSCHSIAGIRSRVGTDTGPRCAA
jgi:hypothetical protein